MAKEGLQPGDRVAVLLPNGTDWVCFDMAAHGQGLVVVALYPYDSATDHAYILAHSEAKLALVGSWARWEMLQGAPMQVPTLSRVWIRDAGSELGMQAKDTVAHHLADVLTEGSEISPVCGIAPTALATLIYTSGTTGRPKGVMLSHAALLRNAAAVAVIIPPRRDDVFLSVLPLAHAFERTIGCYLAMIGGATVAFSRSPQDLAEDMKVLQPTVLLAVPRLFERIYAAIRRRGEANWIGNILLRLLAWLGWRRFEAQQKSRDKVSPGLSLPLYLLDRIVGKSIKASLGGRLRVAVSGGAALDPKIARFLIGVGFPLIEGYGLTEAGPVVTTTALGDTVPGSVGRPLPGVEVKLGPADELFVRSPSLMLGYWKDEEETRRALLESGWLATGDIAEIKDDRVFIRGRLKEIIVLSIGEKINPGLIEAEIARDTLFQQLLSSATDDPSSPRLPFLISSNGSRFAGANAIERGSVPTLQELKSWFSRAGQKRLPPFRAMRKSARRI